jgi:hypothetical protein
MFKRSDGSVGFSFNRLITNTIPNFANDSKNDVDLSPQQMDDLFVFQLHQPDPRVLGPLSFNIQGVARMYIHLESCY